MSSTFFNDIPVFNNLKIENYFFLPPPVPIISLFYIYFICQNTNLFFFKEKKRISILIHLLIALYCHKLIKLYFVSKCKFCLVYFTKMGFNLIYEVYLNANIIYGNCI